MNYYVLSFVAVLIVFVLYSALPLYDSYNTIGGLPLFYAFQIILIFVSVALYLIPVALSERKKTKG